MKFEELIERANGHSHEAFKDMVREDMSRAEALTYWLYIASKLYVLMKELHHIDKGMQPLILGELDKAIEQQLKELQESLKNN